MVHPKPPTQLNQGRRHTHNKEGINMDTTTQAGYDSGALHPEVRVEASLLGHSRKPKQKNKKQHALCSCA